MAGLNVTPDQIAQARAAGYSDQEIVDHLSPQAPEQFDTALKAGYSPTEILQHLAPQPSGIVDSFRQGASEALGGVGSTIKTYVGDGYGGDTLQALGREAAPESFTPSPIIDKQGFHASNIPAWLARQAPAAAGMILAAGAAPEEAAAAAPVGLGAAAGWLMGAGNAAHEAAVNRTGDQNAVPTTADKVRGGLTAGAESAIGALPVTHFIPGAGAIGDVGAYGVASALKRLPAAAVDQSAASAAANAAGQVGQTVGTPGGVNVDPTQVADAAAGGAVMGPVFAAKNAARQGLDAAKYSEITNDPAMRAAATQFANRITQNADGDLEAGRFTSSKAQEVGEDAYQKSRAAVGNELNAAVDDLRSRVTLPVDADNALKSAMGGARPSDKDYATIEAAVTGDPQATNVMNLLRQSHVADIVGDTGHHVAGKFAGGLGGAFTNILKGEHVTKTALAAVGGAAFEGGAGHIIAYSPEVLGTAALGRFLASRLDRLTDAQTPAWRFVRNFGDAQTPVRLNVNQPAPAAPEANNAPLRPLEGPWSMPKSAAAKVAGMRQAAAGRAAENAALPLLKKLAATGEDPKAALAGQIKEAGDLMAARRANAALAARNAPAPTEPAVTTPPLAGGAGSPPMIPPAIQAQIAARANLAKLAAANAPAAAPAPAQPEPVAIPKLPKTLPTDWLSKVRAASEAQEAAKAEVNASPFIEQKLNGAELPTPAAAKAMKTAIGSAQALAKLRSDPAAEAEAVAEAKAEKARTTAAEKARATADKAKAAADKAAERAKATEEKAKVKEAKQAAKDEKAKAKAAKAPPAPKVASEPVNVTKTNSTAQVNDEPFPPSSYAHLPAEHAARAITKAAKDAGNVHHEAGFRAATQARISGERQAMAAVGREVPGLPLADMTARLEGAPDQATAKAYREHLKKVYPRAAASLDQHLSDEAIGRLWRRKGPK